MSNLTKSFAPKQNAVIGTGKAAGVGRPGEVPANYHPDPENPLSMYRNVAGCAREDKLDYIYAIDSWNWHKYDITTWPCADMSFPDLEEDKEYDLWPFKPNMDRSSHAVHWVDLNNQFKSGVSRKGYFLGFTTPEQYVGQDAMKLMVQFEALIQEGDEAKIQAAGFKGLDHIKYVVEYGQKGIKEAFAEAQGVIDEATAQLKEQMDSNIAAAKQGGLLDPIKGISLEDWAAANVKISQAMPLNDVLAVLGVEKPVWDEVSAEWMSRMSQDTTFAISKVYGDAFTNPNIGKFAQAGAAAPAASNGTAEQAKNDFELYIKIMCHQNMGAMQGLDANAVLQQYGLTAGDWGMISGHWAPQMTTNLELIMKMTSLMEKYNAEFAAGAPAKAGADIDF